MRVGHAVVRRRDAAAVLIGLGLGHLTVLGYHDRLLSAPPVSRSDDAHVHRAEIPSGFLANPLAHLVFSLGWFWMVFAIALGAASLTCDDTRVATMCALPVIQPRRTAALLAPVAISTGISVAVPDPGRAADL